MKSILNLFIYIIKNTFTNRRHWLKIRTQKFPDVVFPTIENAQNKHHIRTRMFDVNKTT